MNPASGPLCCTLRSCAGSPVQRVVLEVPAPFRFRAGQYLEIVHPDGVIPLSIASGPARLPELHLHYRSTPGAREAAWMDELLATGGPLRIQGPFGSVFMPDDPDVPLLLVAGGTGISQVCAILDELAAIPTRASVTVLWCADSAAEFYCQEELVASQSAWLRVECVADPRRDAGNAGLRRIAELAADAAAVSGIDGRATWILLGGSPGFVYAALDAIEASGVNPDRVHSDVFGYAPRPARAAAP